MSDGNNRNDIQDYFDLLSSDNKISSLKDKQAENKLNTEALSDVVDEDFFNEIGEKKGDIDIFFEGAPVKKKEVPVKSKEEKAKTDAEQVKRPAPPPMIKKVAPPPVKKPFIKPKQEDLPKPSAQPVSQVEVKEEKKFEIPEAPKPVEKKEKIDISILEKFEGKKDSSSAVLPENAPFKAQVIPKEDNNTDINSNSEKKLKEKNPFKKLLLWFNALPKKKKTIVSIIAIFLALILVLGTVAGVFVMQKFSLMGDSMNDPDFFGDAYEEDIIYDDEEFENIEIDIGSAGFKQSLIDWATKGNDKHMSSKNVVNVLLIGADSRRGKNEGNTDVMMLVSVNKKTKTLKMVSFLRDSYLYIEGDSSSYCTKLNAAYSMGGPECLIQTIENNYKIEIDNYVMVNFESFKAIVDAMGGITVDVKPHEANYISKYFKTDMPSGEGITLNGTQALYFCRVRKCDADGDVSRTRRQRQVIESMVSKATTSSISEINKYIDAFLPYVDTGFSKSQVISLGIKAVTNGWAKYETKQLSFPSTDCSIPGDANMWIWVVDYQKAAHDLQVELYGESNIVLDDGRTSIIDIYRGATYTPSSDNSDDSDNDDTTAPKTTEKVTSTSKTTMPQETKPAETTEKPDTTEPEETVTEEFVPDETEENTEGDIVLDEDIPVQEPDIPEENENIPQPEEALDE